MFIYSIFDKKANVHRVQMVLRDNAEAVRSVARTANNGNSDLFMFSNDFALYNLGELNTDTGRITPIVPIEFVCEVSSLIKLDKGSESN